MRKRLEKRQKESDKHDSQLEKYIREQNRYFRQIDKRKLKVETAKVGEAQNSSNVFQPQNDSQDAVEGVAFTPQNIARALRANYDETYRKIHPELYAKYLDYCDDCDTEGIKASTFEEYLKEAKRKDP
eukprot:CAMPEP_0117447762 /NCGR_PEP_ID=MMETSP0759-20121206/7046_1 /TAXON_ID=63605 /ORGANISM="Percolomonas cosmopolitus, Strain WS" /LENGTH=127 /DNA_ID=CAMNT_0005240115 /DNA_START=197 /DNA_END=576 /DNA_ORIENTATION=+